MARDEDGKTALQFAQQQGHEECIAAFRTYLEEAHEEGVANRRRREAAAEVTAQAASGGVGVISGQRMAEPSAAAGEAGDAGESLVPLLSNVTLEALLHECALGIFDDDSSPCHGAWSCGMNSLMAGAVAAKPCMPGYI